jgi:hypothetical protein
LDRRSHVRRDVLGRCGRLAAGWGEVAPARIPFIGGKRIRPLAAVIPALLGGLTLTVLFGSVPLGGGHSLTAFGVVERVSYDNGWWNALAMICTAPLGVWGPAVVVLAIAYYLRRRPRPAPSCCCPMSKWNANGNRHRDEGSSSNGIAQASALSSAARAGRFRRWPERWGGPCGEVC